MPFDRAGGELLFNVFAERYERRSTLVTSNLGFAEWVQVFGDEKLTTALLDRLSHHAHFVPPSSRGEPEEESLIATSNRLFSVAGSPGRVKGALADSPLSRP